MNKAEAAELLAFAAAFDQRTIGNADVEAWALALADVPWDGSTRAAVAAFYGAPDGGAAGGERRFMQPHNVRTGRTRIRHDRLARVVEPTPNEVEGVAYHEELRAIRRAIADGDIPDQAAAERYTQWGGSLYREHQRREQIAGGGGIRELA